MPRRLVGATGQVGGMAGGKRVLRSPGTKTVPSETTVRAAEARVAEAAKTARLRALRLANEAADRAATPETGPRREGAATRPPRANAAR